VNDRALLNVSSSDVSAQFQQELDDDTVARDDGQEERRVAVRVLDVEEGQVGVQQGRADLRRSVVDDMMQGRTSPTVNRFQLSLQSRIKILTVSNCKAKR